MAGHMRVREAGPAREHRSRLRFGGMAETNRMRRMGRDLTFRLGLLLAAALLAASCCSPRIESFSAEPHYVLPGEPTTVSWKAVGHVALAAKPTLADIGKVEAAGSRTFHVGTDTTFTLHVTRCGKEVFARQAVYVVKNGEKRTVVIRTEPEATGGLLAAQDLPEQAWGDLQVAEVKNLCDRELEIRHAGRVFRMARGASSAALHGTPVAGRWELRAELLPGEVVGDPAHAPPDRLWVQLTVMR